MSERGKGSSMEIRTFIDLMVRTTLFLMEHLILQKLIANCATRVLTTQSINAAGTWRNFGGFKTLLLILFFLTVIKFYLAAFSFEIVY